MEHKRRTTNLLIIALLLLMILLLLAMPQVTGVSPAGPDSGVVAPAPLPTDTSPANPTADWTTYSNETYAYTVKYPPDWVYLEYDFPVVEFFEGPHRVNDPVPQTHVSIAVMRNISRLPLDDWIQANRSFIESPVYFVINGTVAAKWATVSPVGGAAWFVYVPNGNGMYQIALVEMGDLNDKETAEAFELILSTFNVIGKLDFKYEPREVTSFPLEIAATYDREKAYQYAQSYWWRPVDDCIYYYCTPAPDCNSYSNCSSHNDCVHFVSHVMKYGGIDNGHIVNANTLATWLQSHPEIATIVSSQSDLDKGDVILYDWYKDGSWNHAAVVIANNGGGDVGIAEHSFLYDGTWDHWDLPWDNFAGSNASYMFVSIGGAPPPCPPENCTPGRDVGRDFFVQVLERLADVPVSDFAFDALVLWEPYEHTEACWNPLATTLRMEDSCDYFCVNPPECTIYVQHYLTQDMGTQATANTLALSYYDAIRKMLRRESFDREQIRQALIKWSGSGGYVSNLLDEWEALWNDQCGDTTPPTGNITSPSSGSAFKDSLTATSDASDSESGVNRVDFYLYYDGAPHQQADNNGGDGWSVTWDLSGVAEQSGMWLDAWIYDNCGNSRHTNVVSGLMIDRTNPSGSITSPSSDSAFSDSLTAISDANDDRSGVNRVDFYLYYDGAPHQLTDNNGGDGWSVTWDLTGVAEQSGMWLDAWIYDNAGNSHHTNVVTDLRIDRSAPTPTSTPEPGDTTPPTNPTSCIELNGAQNNVWQSSISHPVFSWSGADGTGSDIAGYYHTFSTDPNGTSDYFTTSNTFDFDFSTGWPTGVPYYLRVRTKDTSGNLATAWETIFVFKYDPVPPTVSFDRANGISISAGQDVSGNVTNWTFEGTANDSGAGLDSIVFGAWGNNYGAGWNDTAGTSSPWSYSQNGLSGHNRIHFWATDKANNVSERQYIELYVDSASPSTSASLNGTVGYNSWYRSPVQVALFATDYGSGSSGTIGGIPNHYIAGVDYTRYQIDGGSWQTYSSSFLVSGDGTHTVDYYSVDAVGNEESARSLTIKIDTTPPTGSLSVNRGASTSYSLNVVLGLSANDGSGSGVSQMRFSNSNPDWSEWEIYAAEKAWKLTDGSGSKAVYVQFQDAAGNISEYSASIFVDLYPDKPASQNYRIFKSVVGVGGESKTSENYQVGNTTGQPAMGPAPERSQSSESFRLVAGYWAMQPWPLFGDFNHDCKIDVGDIMQVASRWSCRRGDDCYRKHCDLNRDGNINIVDIMLVAIHWGETCP